MSHTAPCDASPRIDPHALFELPLRRLTVARDGGDELQRCIQRGDPAIIDDFAASWPALKRWTPEALAARVGDRTVRVYDASFGEPGRNYMRNVDSIPFARYLQQVMEQGRDLRMFLYNISRQVPELLDDIEFPDIGQRFSRKFVFTFFGCKGSTTPLHYDIDMGQVFHTVIRGRRRVRLFAPNQSRSLYKHPFTVRSYVDLDDPNLAAWPALARVEGHEVVLDPGQTLYMPPGWWHEFHYLDAGIGVSLRAPGISLGQHVQGLVNLLVLSPIDRVANRVAGRRWFAWKRERARRRAELHHQEGTH